MCCAHELDRCVPGTVRQGGDAESQTRELNLNVNEFVSENHSGTSLCDILNISYTCQARIKSWP